jgi:hypothetical protein
MPEINQIFFTHKELLELLIKQAGVHEGRWILSAAFGFTAGNFGPAPEQMAPGAIVAITQVGIQRAARDTPDAMAMDAAVVNPKSAA